MTTLEIDLPGNMVDFVESLIAEGGYSSLSEVVQDARLLLQHDKALEAEKLAILRREIDLGLDDAAAGRFSKKTVKEIVAEVEREYRDARASGSIEP